jgi:Tfp pilus tip-associated adhesin PilY1
MASIRPAAFTLIAGLALLVSPLHAQLNPNSAWQKSKSDFLDLYQGNKTKGLKPEILMVIDNSGSTGRLMFHKLFPNNWQDENPPNTETGSSCVSLVISNSSWPTGTVSGGTGTLGSTLVVGFGSAYNATTPTTTFTASGATYSLGNSGKRGTVTIGTYTYPYNTLIKPDGSEVTADDVVTAGGNRSNAVDWMRCASHIRFCLVSYKIGSTTTTLAVPRYVDFPIPWRPIDSSSTISSTYRGLTPVLAHDPVANTTNTQIDTDTSTTYPTYDTTSNQASVCVYGGFNNSSYLNIRTRYLEWIFMGTDPSNGYYCIPNALPANSATDKTTQRSINPTSISWDGASDTYSWAFVTETATPKDLSKGWVTAFDNGLPTRSRIQAIKEGVIKAWLGYQTQVMFAYRFLDSTNLSQSLTGTPAWTYINSVSDLSSVQSTSPNGSTPLIESVEDAYSQMTNPAAFAAQIGTSGYTASQLACQKHFVIVMTDGAPSTGGEGTCYPYSQTATLSCAGTYSAGANPTVSGNNAIKANNSLVTASSGAAWNIGTLAGIAAHGGDPGTGSTKTWIKDPLTATFSGAVSNWIPFWVTKRTTGGVSGTVQTFTTAHPIQTMTVGVSLGVNFYSSGTTVWTNAYGSSHAPTVATGKVPIQSDLTGSKYRLLAGAYFGDPASTSYDITTAGPFYLPAGQATKPTDAAYFFDGRDPDTLVQNLDDAFSQITKIATINATAAPVFPTIGGGLGAEVYLANFLPSGNSGPLWTGDLLMYPTKETSTGTRLVDGSGNLLTTNLNDTNAQWSAADALAARGWTNRVIYSRLAATSGTPNPSLFRVNLGSSGTNTSDSGYTAISSLLPGATTAIKLKNWQFFVGADVGSSTSPLTTRDSIMGDIINSSPAVLEYTTLPSSVSSFSNTLANAWALHKPSNSSGDTSGHFRVILVGTNQGFLHCFGEVSWTDSTTNPSVPVTKGVVDELWAFAPTDALPYIDQLQVSGNSHQFIVDGPPTIYLLDLPQTSTQTSGNGKFDVNGSNTERAIAIFGLGKGGRSYYAINIADPGTPSMQWALCPDEPFNYPSSRIKSGQASTPIANMGLATSTPTVARVTTSRQDSSKANLIVDAILLGGGYSDQNIEAALPGSPAGPALNTKLGRSAIAIEANSGNILAIWDTSGTTGAGPVSTGVVPFEYAVGSGLHQRAYFTDYYGSLWALSSSTAQGSSGGLQNFRLDSASVDGWSARQVYSQAVAASSAGNGVVSTLPVPFNIPYFPVVRTSAPTVAPSAVGIAFVTGDRNNPLDDMTYTLWTKPSQHRINVLFDRQDNLGAAALTATDLADASSGSFSTSSTSSTYFLRTGFGYFINFPSLATNGGTFVPKGIVTPLLIDGALFYSYFSPNTSSCAGGSGTTDTFRICNVMQPVVNSSANFSSTDASTVTAINGCKSGRILSWTGVASMLALRSVLAGVQAGMTGGSGVNINASQPQNLLLQDLTVQGSNAYGKIRVWRTIH